MGNNIPTNNAASTTNVFDTIKQLQKNIKDSEQDFNSSIISSPQQKGLLDQKNADQATIQSLNRDLVNAIQGNPDEIAARQALLKAKADQHTAGTQFEASLNPDQLALLEQIHILTNIADTQTGTAQSDAQAMIATLQGQMNLTSDQQTLYDALNTAKDNTKQAKDAFTASLQGTPTALGKWNDLQVQWKKVETDQAKLETTFTPQQLQDKTNVLIDNAQIASLKAQNGQNGQTGQTGQISQTNPDPNKYRSFSYIQDYMKAKSGNATGPFNANDFVTAALTTSDPVLKQVLQDMADLLTRFPGHTLSLDDMKKLGCNTTDNTGWFAQDSLCGFINHAECGAKSPEICLGWIQPYTPTHNQGNPHPDKLVTADDIADVLKASIGGNGPYTAQYLMLAANDVDPSAKALKGVLTDLAKLLKAHPDKTLSLDDITKLAKSGNNDNYIAIDEISHPENYSPSGTQSPAITLGWTPPYTSQFNQLNANPENTASYQDVQGVLKQTFGNTSGPFNAKQLQLALNNTDPMETALRGVLSDLVAFLRKNPKHTLSLNDIQKLALSGDPDGWLSVGEIANPSSFGMPDPAATLLWNFVPTHGDPKQPTLANDQDIDAIMELVSNGKKDGFTADQFLAAAQLTSDTALKGVLTDLSNLLKANAGKTLSEDQIKILAQNGTSNDDWIAVDEISNPAKYNVQDPAILLGWKIVGARDVTDMTNEMKGASTRMPDAKYDGQAKDDHYLIHEGDTVNNLANTFNALFGILDPTQKANLVQDITNALKPQPKTADETLSVQKGTIIDLAALWTKYCSFTPTHNDATNHANQSNIQDIDTLMQESAPSDKGKYTAQDFLNAAGRTTDANLKEVLTEMGKLLTSYAGKTLSEADIQKIALNCSNGDWITFDSIGSPKKYNITPVPALLWGATDPGEGSGCYGWGDPHFVLPSSDGKGTHTYDVQGKANTVFNLVSDENVEDNALFTAWNPNPGANIMSDIGIRIGSKADYTDIEFKTSTGVPTKDGQPMVKGKTYVFMSGLMTPDGNPVSATAMWDGQKLIVNSGKEVFTLKEEVASDGTKYLDQTVQGTTFKDNITAHGIQGQMIGKTLDKDYTGAGHEQGEGLLEGTWQDYEIAGNDLFGTDVDDAFNRFDKNQNA